MPTTPNGTAYTVTTFTSSAGETCKRAVADAHSGDEHLPLVIFCHGNPGVDQTSADDQFTANYPVLRAWLIDNGWGYVEGHGAGANWGNTPARVAYRAMYQDTAAVWDVGWNVVIGRSMGGLVGAYLAARDPVISPRCQGFISLSGTADLTNRYSTASAQDRTNLLAAYSVPDATALAWAVRDHDPMLFDEAAWLGRNVSIQYATGDVSVPPNVNALPWLAKYGPFCAVARSTATADGDHNSTASGDPAQAQATIAFLRDVVPAYTEPPLVVGTRISRVRGFVDGKLVDFHAL